MAVDAQRRKAVMSRSIKLGHCVCNPKKPCPCDVFKEHNVCQCAGEKLAVKTGGAIALTRHVRKAGCASKIGQADLLRILGTLPPVEDPNVLVGTAAGDDAGVYRLSDTQALVQTVDVFTPCVDDPALFGRIAAANSVSDVYAMGGRPITALSVVGFPIDELDGKVMEAMLQGAMEKLAEADCSLVGGHSINDEEIKLGFAVTGLIDPSLTVQRNHAKAGDVLVLTKALGTGMVAFASQLGRASDACLEEIGASMATLNRDAAELMVTFDAHACTDVTGYGLGGHLVEMARNSGVAAEIDLAAIPVFAAVAECLEQDILSGAIERNQQYAMAWVHPPDGPAPGLPILYDPQTSGGLLISLPPDRAEAYVAEMHGRGHSATAVIGRLVEQTDGRTGITIMGGELQNLVGTRGGIMTKEQASPAPAVTPAADETSACCDAPPDEPCCEGGPPLEVGAGGDPMAAFMAFMKEANSPGLIDQRAKKLMAVALSISQRCEPCLKIHLKGAFSMGISKAEVDEAAALATAFGGCTALMFYKGVCKEMGV